MDKTASLIKAKRQITSGAIAGWVLASLSIINCFVPFYLFPSWIISMYFHSTILGLSPHILLSLLSAFIIVGLTIGVHIKNQMCAILLFGCGVLALIVTLVMVMGYFVPTIVILVIVVFLLIGMIGTFDYHQLTARYPKI